MNAGVNLLTLVALSAVSCTSRPVESTSFEDEVNVETVSKGTSDEVQIASRRMRPAEFDGDYYMGDGRGRNLTIRLRADSTFEACRFGCLGLYGLYGGTWSLDGGGVVLNALRIEDVREESQLPSRLRVVADSGRVGALLEPDAVGWFGMVGLQRDCAFVRQVPEKPTDTLASAEAVDEFREVLRHLRESGKSR